MLGYNGSGCSSCRFLTTRRFLRATGFSLVVLPKSDLLARKPR